MVVGFFCNDVSNSNAYDDNIGAITHFVLFWPI
jgi:hypothetical protein